MMKKLQADAIVIGCVLLIAVLLLWVRSFGDHTDAQVTISQDGKLLGNYPLSEDATIPVADDETGFNIVLISDGTVRVCDADCPDKLCVKQKAVSKNGESIICLPHKLVVQILSKEESDLDAVTN